MNRPFALACLTLVLCSLPGSLALAQRSSRYTPQRPTISPYFGFFQFNTTPLPNYQAFVRPREELLLNTARDEARLGQLEREINLRTTGGGTRLMREDQAESGTPSRAARYLNLQPYYPLQQSIRVRR
jgi:hypothetical protein